MFKQDVALTGRHFLSYILDEVSVRLEPADEPYHAVDKHHTNLPLRKIIYAFWQFLLLIRSVLVIVR